MKIYQVEVQLVGIVAQPSLIEEIKGGHKSDSRLQEIMRVEEDVKPGFVMHEMHPWGLIIDCVSDILELKRRIYFGSQTHILKESDRVGIEIRYHQ